MWFHSELYSPGGVPSRPRVVLVPEQAVRLAEAALPGERPSFTFLPQNQKAEIVSLWPACQFSFVL